MTPYPGSERKHQSQHRRWCAWFDSVPNIKCLSTLHDTDAQRSKQNKIGKQEIRKLDFTRDGKKLGLE
jgi:hypothetical protein